MIGRNTIRGLLLAVVGLPVLQAVIFWVSGLLVAMGDAAAAGVLRHIGTAAGVLWLVGLVALVIGLAVRTLENEGPGDEPPAGL